MVLLADQPFIDGAVLRVLMNAFNENVGMIISPAEIEGSRSLRSLWDRSMWQAAASLEGDVGARSLFRSPLYRGRIIEANELQFMDIDTVDRYEEAKRYLLTTSCQIK